jgi:antitoxin component of RelBE/YafQ-DinJ toxin-antitoxin module
MRKHYDFSHARKNPYASRLKKSVTIRLDEGAISYFKGMAEQVGVPYQSLINLYLKDCAATQKKLNLTWKSDPAKSAASSRSLEVTRSSAPAGRVRRVRGTGRIIP